MVNMIYNGYDLFIIWVLGIITGVLFTWSIMHIYYINIKNYRPQKEKVIKNV
jgi:hypothetical protein